MFSRSLTLNMIGEVAVLVLGFVASVLLARLLGPADRGLLAIELSVANFAYAIFGFGLPYSVEYHAGRRESPGAILGTTAAFGLVLGLVLVPLTWFLRGPIADVFSRGHGGATWVLVGLLVPLTFLQWTAANQLSGLLRFGLFNGLLIGSRVVYTVLAVGLLVAGLGVTAGLLATAAAAVVMLVGAVRALLPLGRPRIDLSIFRRMLHYGLRLQVGSLFQILNFRLDVIVLQIFRPLAVVGYYIVAQVVAELVTTLASGFQSSVTPLVANADADVDRDHTTALALRHQSLLTFAAIAVVAICGPVLLIVGFGPQFQKSLLPMFIILPGTWFLNTGAVVAASLGGRGRPGLASMLSGIALGVTLALDFVLIPAFGVIGAAVASLCAYTTYGIAALLVSSRMMGISPWALVRPTRDDLRTYSTATRLLLLRARRPRSSPA